MKSLGNLFHLFEGFLDTFSEKTLNNRVNAPKLLAAGKDEVNGINGEAKVIGTRIFARSKNYSFMK